MSKLINMGIVAHIDAGKTTATEQLLYLSGAIRSAGSVDKGTAQTDYMEVERTRGISVKMATTEIMWHDTKINIIDTPGHADFAVEAERAMQALDCAVLVVSAVEGVEARTELLWDALEKLGIPVIIFVNKIDRSGASLSNVTEQIKSYLTENCVIIQSAQNEGSDNFEIRDSVNDAEQSEKIIENDDELLEKYLGGKSDFSNEALLSSLKKSCQARKLFPVVCGSALKSVGVDGLMNAIVALFPTSEAKEGEPSGVIFKIDHDKLMGRVAHVRLYSGCLKSRDTIYNATAGCNEKITQIRKFYGQRYEDTGILRSGDIAALCGLNSSRVGDVLGSGEGIPSSAQITEPLLQIRVMPQNDGEYAKLVEAMQELSAEDPSLNMIWEKSSRQLLISVTGLIQLTVIEDLLNTRFQIKVSFGDPTVIYKETPLASSIGFVSYTMPKPCWAVLKFEISPAPLGSGVHYSSEVPNNKIYYRYQNQVEQAISTALRQGPLGWEVTDINIKLVDGEHHNEHTHPLDFIVATPMGIMDGLSKIGTSFLEPIMNFRINAPEECSGRIMSDIINMRGSFEPPITKKDRIVISGEYPVATSLEYPIRLATITSGRGTLSASFGGYKPCSSEFCHTTPYRGVNPLDRSKYILYIRSALSE